MTRKKIVYAILKEIDKGNTNFNYKDFNISSKEYMSIIHMMHNRFIMDMDIIDYHIDDIYGMAFMDKTKLTLEGENFLENNSKWAKTYKGIKEFASWIPGIG